MYHVTKVNKLPSIILLSRKASYHQRCHPEGDLRQHQHGIEANGTPKTSSTERYICCNVTDQVDIFWFAQKFQGQIELAQCINRAETKKWQEVATAPRFNNWQYRKEYFPYSNMLLFKAKARIRQNRKINEYLEQLTEKHKQIVSITARGLAMKLMHTFMELTGFDHRQVGPLGHNMVIALGQDLPKSCKWV